MQLLVTGANGQLGFEVARLGKLRGLDLKALTRAELDIGNRNRVKAVIEQFRPKIIVNAAAYTSVDKAENEAELAFCVNRDGPGYLAEVARDIGAVLFHVSTDYVFDGTKVGPYVESDPVSPLGVYGASKEAGENAVREATNRHVILRTAWVFDAHGANFVKTMLRLAKEREELRVVDDQVGCPTHAADLADAALTLAVRILADSFPANGFGTFHCAGSGQTTWCGLARKTFELSVSRLGKTPTVIPIPSSEYQTPALRPANSVLDCSLLNQVHGLKLRPWSQALEEMLSSLPNR